MDEQEKEQDKKISSIEDDEVEKILSSIKKDRTNFEVKIDNKALKEIPDYQEENPKEIAVKKQKHKMPVFAKIMVAFSIIGISILISFGIIFVAQDVFGMKKYDSEINIEIPEKSGVADIADILEENGVVKSALMFKVYYKLAKVDGNLNYGRFDLNTNMAYSEIINVLKKYSATKEEVTVTFPEGLTLYEMSLKLEKAGVCNAKDFLEILNTKDFDYDFAKAIKPNKLRFHKLEGYVFPDTYNFYKDDNPYNVADKMLSEFDKRVTKEMRANMEKMGYSLQETMTIASIVQKEAGKTAEMKKVASVYFNRLNNDDVYPNLQACPTRDYANQLKKQMDILNQDVLDAYNTYEDAGLPPGPICNPGLEALTATLDPEKTDYFYFCSNLKTGEFFYGKTLQEHQRNLIKAGLA